MMALVGIAIRVMRLLTFSLLSVSIVSHGWSAESDETRVEEILGQMTLEEKLDYLGGANAMSIRPISSLSVPEIHMSDGPLGVRRDTPSTRYPGGVLLAASWNRALAAREG